MIRHLVGGFAWVFPQFLQLEHGNYQVSSPVTYPQGIIRIIVNPKNKETFSAPPVGEVSNLAGVECPINSKLYYRLCISKETKAACNNGAGDLNTETIKFQAPLLIRKV